MLKSHHRALLLVLGACATAACLRPDPIVEKQIHEIVPGSLAKVAVVPLYPQPQERPRAQAPPEPQPQRETRPPLHTSPDMAAPAGAPVGAAEAVELVSRFLSEALEAEGIAVVAPSDLVLAFEGKGLVLPRRDVGANAKLAAEQFGATSVLLGRVLRYQEREGEALGVRRPASVWFEVSLYTAPGGVHLASARFDQTQQSLSSNVLLARKYPGRGTRWLTVGELARWGAEHVVRALKEASP